MLHLTVFSFSKAILHQERPAGKRNLARRGPSARNSGEKRTLSVYIDEKRSGKVTVLDAIKKL
ncbi:MAG: hypothetical protein II882_01805 [Lachnospiraceae bacterium]|nr:hypothetical protein [Lachnospiraceae bacterium]